MQNNNNSIDHINNFNDAIKDLEANYILPIRAYLE